MPQVQTVTGPAEASQLGSVLTHEHVIFDPFRSEPAPQYSWDEVTQRATAELEELREVGIGTFVDVTPVGNGRSPEVLAEISRRSGVLIVASTGFYRDAPLLELAQTDDIDGLASLMEGELTMGMAGTTIRAGVIKVGTGKELTPGEEKVLRAAARASRKTGAAITTHTESGELAQEQVEILDQEGADLNRVVIGHVGDRPDLDLHLAVARRGACVGYDRMGWRTFPVDASIDIILQMVRRGFIDQIALSHDTPIYIYGRYVSRLDPRLGTPSAGQRRGFLYVHQVFVEKLHRAGLSDSQVETILVKNPARILCS